MTFSLYFIYNADTTLQLSQIMLILHSMQRFPVLKEISQHQEPRGSCTAEVWQALKQPSQLFSMVTSFLEELRAQPQSRWYYLIPSGKTQIPLTWRHLTAARYNPIQKYAPQDCVASINAIIKNIDQLVNTHNTAAITKLKAIFGLESLTDTRDFAQTIAWPSKQLLCCESVLRAD
jgi:hypothetical protein